MIQVAIEEVTKIVEEAVTGEVFGVWFLIGAACVILERQPIVRSCQNQYG